MDVSWEPGGQIDVSPLGVLTAQVMEQVSERYGSDAFVQTAAVVVEICCGEGRTHILTAANDQRPWVQLAFLDEGKWAVEQRRDDLERELEE